MKEKEVIERLLDSLNGRLVLPLVEAGRLIGYKRQSCYNMRSRGVFPVKIKEVNGRPMVRTSDIIEFVQS